MKAKLNFFLLLFCLTIFSDALSQKQSLFDHYYDLPTEIPKIKLETDFKQLLKRKNKEEYQPATATFAGADDTDVTLTCEIRARGNMRKKVCRYPPIKINLKKGDLDSLGFKKADILKLVVSCKANDSFAERAMLEHLVYELYAVIDSNAMRTKLVDVEFWNEGKLKETLRGFLVEEEEHYVKRTDAIIIEKGVIRSGALDRPSFLKMVLFQYMIANTDWAIPNRHNVEIAKFVDRQRVSAIPYDFDYAGFVNQPYAVPSPKLPIRDVQERYIMSKDIKEAELEPMREFYRSVQDEFIKICDNATYLSEDKRKYAKKYIASFYKILNNKSSSKKKLVWR